MLQKNGFRILNKIKKDYIDDKDDQFKEFKSNVFENRKHIKSNFIKIKKLSKEQEEILFDEKYDNKETRKEKLEEIEEVVELSSSIANMFFLMYYNITDNQTSCVEGAAYSGSDTSGYKIIYNDMDANNPDYFIKLNIENKSFDIAFRDFNIDKYDDVEHKGNSIIVINKKWNDQYEIPDIEIL